MLGRPDKNARDLDLANACATCGALVRNVAEKCKASADEVCNGRWNIERIADAGRELPPEIVDWLSTRAI